MRWSHILIGTAAIVAVAAAAHAQDRETRRNRDIAATIIRVFGDEDGDRAALGVTTRSTGERDTLGLLIERVTPDSPADKAGLQEGNRIASINGVNLRLAPADAGEPDMQGLMTRRLTRELRKVKPGDEVELRVYADGQYKTVRVKTVALEDLESPGMRVIRLGREDDEDRAAVGLGFGGSGSQRDTLGLLVISIASGGPAEKAGLVEGDRVMAINGVDVRVPPGEAGSGELLEAKRQRFIRELGKVKPGDEVELRVYANGAVKTVKVKTARAADVYPRSRGFRIFFDRDAMAPMPVVPPTPSRPAVAPLPPIPRTPAYDVQRVDEARRAEVRARAIAEAARAQLRKTEAVQRDMRRAVAKAEARAAARGAAARKVSMLRSRVPSTYVGWSHASALKGFHDDGTFELAGLRLTTVSDDLAPYFGKGSERGLLVLDADSPWDELAAGDVILSINDKPVRRGDATEFSVDTSKDTRFEVLRKGKRQTVVVPAQ